MHQPDTSDHPAGLSIRRSAQLSHFSKRVTCKLASSYVERDAIFKLRYKSYLRAGLISENSFGQFLERADHAANTYVVGLYVDRKLVSSLRLQMGSPLTPGFSSLELFPNVLEPLRRSNKTVVDLSCVATDGELARQYVWLPYIVLRSWIVAAELSTPEQKCISWPEQKYISDAGNKAPELGPFLEALSLGGIVHRHFRAGTA